MPIFTCGAAKICLSPFTSPELNVFGLIRNVGPDISRQPEIGGWGPILALSAFTYREPQTAGFGHWTDLLPHTCKYNPEPTSPINMHGTGSVSRFSDGEILDGLIRRSLLS